MQFRRCKEKILDEISEISNVNTTLQRENTSVNFTVFVQIESLVYYLVFYSKSHFKNNFVIC